VTSASKKGKSLPLRTVRSEMFQQNLEGVPRSRRSLIGRPPHIPISNRTGPIDGTVAAHRGAAYRLYHVTDLVV
jgi:hypothetical protein